MFRASPAGELVPHPATRHDDPPQLLSSPSLPDPLRRRAGAPVGPGHALVHPRVPGRTSHFEDACSRLEVLRDQGRGQFANNASWPR